MKSVGTRWKGKIDGVDRELKIDQENSANILKSCLAVFQMKGDE